MAQNGRTKEIWLIPKRNNVHQAICLLDTIIEKSFDGTSWNDQKQNTVGSGLKKWGATKDGKNISNQGIRTLVASISYLGFLYLNTNSTPTTINVTRAGYEFWEKHRSQLQKISNLVVDKDLLISESSLICRQMEKLQITNPIILKDCENILLFPFRLTLELLLELKYLDREEIAIFLFRARKQDEKGFLIREIKNFRKLSGEDRYNLVEEFKKTDIGNITLVQAPSSGYFIGLCCATGIIEQKKVNVAKDKFEKLPSISIKESYIQYVEDLIEENKKVKPFDYGSDLKLWIDYIGNPSRNYPPVKASFKNMSKDDCFIQIRLDDQIIDQDLFNHESECEFNIFPYEDYTVVLYDIEKGQVRLKKEIHATLGENVFEIISESENPSAPLKNCETIKNDILEHCKSQKFSSSVLNYLKILNKHTGQDFSGNSLRGAYLESYFYDYLSILKAEGVLDDVIWNGRKGKYGLPSSAPGGINGTPDIIFIIDNYAFVLELTTIKSSKDLQFKAEGASVPDHVKRYRDNHPQFMTYGIFTAPKIFSRCIETIKAYGSKYDLVINGISVSDLLEILGTKDRRSILEALKNFNSEFYI